MILFSPLLFIQSNILAQSITFAPDDPVLENELVKKRGEAGSQLFDTGIEFYQKK